VHVLPGGTVCTTLGVVGKSIDSKVPLQMAVFVSFAGGFFSKTNGKKLKIDGFR